MCNIISIWHSNRIPPSAAHIFVAVHGYGINQEEEAEQPSIKDAPASFSFKLDLLNGNFATVFENVIPYSLRSQMMEYRSHGALVFTLSNYSWTQDLPSNIGLTPWIQDMPIETLNKFAVWKNFLPLLEDHYGMNLKIEHAQYEVSHSLDARPPVVPQYCDKDRHIVTIFLNKFWAKNNYGQLSFYADIANKNLSSSSRLEIVESVHPRGGRAVVYPSCQINVFHPPTASFFKHMFMMSIWFSTNVAQPDPIVNPLSQTAKKPNKIPESFEQFKFKKPFKVVLGKALKRTFYDSKGKKGLFFYDEVFSTDELREWRMHLLKHSDIRLNIHDTSAIEENDNVPLISMYNVSSFMKTDMWKRVHQQISFITNEDGWYPYDVALNFVRSSDQVRLHPDSEEHQHEYTYLLYLTEGIESENMGETIWAEMTGPNDGITQFTGDGGEEYELHAGVKPKFGRVAIFYNNVEHSARPLNTAYFGDRYTFAVKVGRTKRNAFAKLCYESFEGVNTRNKKLKKVFEQLRRGRHDEGTGSKLSVDYLVKIHEHLVSMKMTSTDKWKIATEQALTSPLKF